MTIITPWEERCSLSTTERGERVLMLAEIDELRAFKERVESEQSNASPVNAELVWTVTLLTGVLKTVEQCVANYGTDADRESIAIAIKTGDAALSNAQAKPALTQEQLRKVLNVLMRYRNETPLGHQPPMITDAADEAIEIMKGAL